MKITQSILILLSVFLFTLPLMAQDGALVLEKGKLKIVHEQKSVLYEKPGEEILVYAGDKIHTGSDTRATIYLRNKSEEISLYSKTFFVVSKVEAKVSRINLWLGKARFLVKPAIDLLTKERRHRRFEVNTTSATLGVKGTEFIVSTDKTGTLLFTLSGVVGFTSHANKNVEVDVTKNQVSSVTRGALPTPPVMITDSQRDQIIGSDTGTPWFNEDENPFPDPVKAKQAGEEGEPLEELLGDVEGMLDDFNEADIEPSVNLRVDY